MIREHLYFEKLTIKYDLSRMLSIAPISANTLMTKKFPLAPQHIDAFIDAMKLDKEDALTLRLQGAIESGWQLTAMKKPRL